MLVLEKIPALVIDTHIWIWEVAGDKRVEQLQKYRGRQVLSAISVWEVAMLAAKGRLKLKPDVATWVARNLESPVEMEPLAAEISVRSSQLENFHGDPADRLIVATAMVLQIPLITADEQIQRWNQKAKVLSVVGVPKQLI